MATITVETGTGSASSNSYISESDFETYASDRGVTLTGVSAELLIKAMDYIESINFKGYKYTDAQALQWPRGSVYVDGYSVLVTGIPTLLKDALCEVAIGVDTDADPLGNEDRQTKKEKVGDIEVEYMDGSRNYTYLKAAHCKLTKLMSGSSGVVIRG